MIGFNKEFSSLKALGNKNFHYYSKSKIRRILSSIIKTDPQIITKYIETVININDYTTNVYNNLKFVSKTFLIDLSFDHYNSIQFLLKESINLCTSNNSELKNNGINGILYVITVLNDSLNNNFK